MAVKKKPAGKGKGDTYAGVIVLKGGTPCIVQEVDGVEILYSADPGDRIKVFPNDSAASGAIRRTVKRDTERWGMARPGMYTKWPVYK